MLNDSEQDSIHRAGQAVTPPSPSIVPGPDRPGGGFFVMGSGWIKLHRGITDHWIWSDPVKLKWWLDLLLMVNHEPKKVLIGGTLIECGRGQTVRSLNTFSEKWLVTKKTVKTFLELLQSDDMIRIENVKISTRITICNYEYYQDSVNGKETTGKRQVHAKETPSKRELPPNKNDKEREERKECKEGEEGIISRRVKFEIPTREEVKAYFSSNGYTDESAGRFFEYYSVSGWVDSKGDKVRNWKQKAQAVWFKDENKKPVKQTLVFPR